MSENDPREESSPRTIVRSIEVKATPDEVFHALSDAEALKAWFPVDARVSPGANGRIWLSWGATCEGEGTISAWEPGRHFGWHEQHGPRRVSVDFHLEGKGGSTVVRLVQSGFGLDARFDDEFDATARGWRYELGSLKHYLERHRGSRRVSLWVASPDPMSADEGWARLTAPSGLGLSVDVGRRTFALAGAAGCGLQGDLEILDVPSDLSGTVPALNDALFRYLWEGGKPHLWLWVWDAEAKALAPYETAWRAAFA